MARRPRLTDLLRWNIHRAAVLCALVALGGALFPGALPAWFLLLTALLVLVSADGMFRPGSSLFHPAVSHGDRASRKVALSFDDGPDPEVTPQVLDVLKRHGVRATFFVVGRALAAQPELGRRMAAEGHVLANHSWQHSFLQNFYMTGRHVQELTRCEEAIAAATGRRPLPLYRPPVGIKSGELGHALWKMGLTLVAWSVHSRDTLDADPGRIAQRVLKRIRGGDIVLLHDGHHLPGRHRGGCAEAVSIILEGLRERGLECVTLPELLGIGPEAESEPLPGRPEALT
jgi:peptidoglycan/xylan/chitin deacetylase (PgdA/CDA1 family)